MQDTLQVIAAVCLGILGVTTAFIGIHCTRGSTETTSVTIEALGPVCAVTSTGDHEERGADS